MLRRQLFQRQTSSVKDQGLEVPEGSLKPGGRAKVVPAGGGGVMTTGVRGTIEVQGGPDQSAWKVDPLQRPKDYETYREALIMATNKRAL
jgi:hypothetical protein